MNTKLLLFFLLILVSIAFSGYISKMLVQKSNLDTKTALAGVSVFLTTVLALIFKLGKICPETSEKFHFELTPAKQCMQGPYMWSSADPEKQAFCNAMMDSGAVSEYSCGTPVMVGLKYNGPGLTPISDDHWRNERCNTCTKKSFYDPVLNKNLGNPGVL